MGESITRLHQHASDIISETREALAAYEVRHNTHRANLVQLRTERADFWAHYQTAWDEHRTTLDRKRVESQVLVDELHSQFDARREASGELLDKFKVRWVDFNRDERELSEHDLPDYLADELAVKEEVGALNEYGVDIIARCKAVWTQVEDYSKIVSAFNEVMLDRSRDLSEQLNTLLDEGHRSTSMSLDTLLILLT